MVRRAAMHFADSCRLPFAVLQRWPMLVIGACLGLAACQERSEEGLSSSGGSGTSEAVREEDSSASDSAVTPDPQARGPALGEGAGSALESLADSDTALTAKVKAALAAGGKVNATDIHVETQDAEVILSGFVDSPVEMSEAVRIARGVAGVNKVTNKLKPRTS